MLEDVDDGNHKKRPDGFRDELIIYMYIYICIYVHMHGVGSKGARPQRRPGKDQQAS